MKKGFINILIYLFLPSLITLLFFNILNINNFTYFIFTVLPFILLLVYFLFKYKKIFMNDLKKINKKKFLTMFIIWIIGFSLMMLLNYIINYIIFDNGIASNELANRLLLKLHPITYSLLMCLILPILEEISFRLEFKHNLKNKITFILLSSFIFSLAHIISLSSILDLLYILPYFILGLTFSFIYQKTDCIYFNILSHIMHNTVCVIVILFF